jgi:hypothetical protein
MGCGFEVFQRLFMHFMKLWCLLAIKAAGRVPALGCQATLPEGNLENVGNST